MAEAPALDGAAVRERWPLPNPQGSSDKDERGQVAVVGGATHTPGAVLLAGIAALRTGAGKLTMATTETTAVALAVAVPEAGVLGWPCTADGALDRSAASQAGELLSGVDAVLIGPGMADPETTRELVAELLSGVGEDTVVVLDALACSCGVVSDGLGALAGRTVITPNRTEAGHLIDDPDGEETDVAQRIADAYGVTVALGSSVALAGAGSWRVPKGNPGLGTSGSGDVLAGAVAGIAARTRDPAAAATWGLLLHGTAGDRLAAGVAEVGFLARELLDQLPLCLRQLSQ